MTSGAIARDTRVPDPSERALREIRSPRFESELSLQLCRAVEQAAIAAAYTIGRGDPQHSDLLAVEAMRRELGRLPIDATIVIGEGERDAAPMLYIGEKLGTASGLDRNRPAIDIAVDPLEGTNLCANAEPNSIAVLAASERGGLLHAPDLYMEKIIVGPSARDAVDLDAPVEDNLRAIARALGLRLDDVLVAVLDRPRHERLIAKIRGAGARVHPIADGDLCAGLSTAEPDSGIHAVMGVGGAPEGVLTAAGLRCLGGELLARLVISTPEQEERCHAMGIEDCTRVYRARDLACGEQVIFAATGVTDGTWLDGVRFLEGELRTMSLLMQCEPRTVRFIETIHPRNTERPPTRG